MNVKTIEQIYENCKASLNEETSYSEKRNWINYLMSWTELFMEMFQKITESNNRFLRATLRFPEPQRKPALFKLQDGNEDYARM